MNASDFEADRTWKISCFQTTLEKNAEETMWDRSTFTARNTLIRMWRNLGGHDVESRTFIPLTIGFAAAHL